MVTHTAGDVMYTVVILVGRIGAHSCDVVIIFVHTFLDLSALIAVAGTQAPVRIDAILATHADDVCRLKVVLDIVGHIGIVVPAVITDTHRLVGYIFIIQADDATSANYTCNATQEVPRSRERVSEVTVIAVLIGTIEQIGTMIGFQPR